MVSSDDLGAFGEYLTSKPITLPDYRQALKEARNVDIEDTHIAFCDYMSFKIGKVFMEFILKLR